MDNKKSFLFFNIILAAVLVLIDQTIKYLIRQSGGFYLCNPSLAWGIKIPNWLFWILWCLVIFFIVLFISQKIKQALPKNSTYFLAPFFILAGALGNFIDRICWNCVIDYIDFKIWPVFNLADSLIVLGFILIVLEYLKKK